MNRSVMTSVAMATYRPLAWQHVSKPTGFAGRAILDESEPDPREQFAFHSTVFIAVAFGLLTLGALVQPIRDPLWALIKQLLEIEA